MSVSHVKDHVKSVTIFGSSSPRTPQMYCDAAFDLGAGLASLGYRCVHGGGKYGVMGSITSGAQSRKGAVFGVVHAQFCVDNGEDQRLVLENSGCALHICDGPDLVIRKKMLYDNGDCIVVMPGGIGTFEELCETVSAKSLGMMGLKKKGICVCNVNGYFDGFIQMMHRASKDDLLYGNVDLFFDVVSTPAEAIEWCKNKLSNLSTENSEMDDAVNSRVIVKDNSSIASAVSRAGDDSRPHIPKYTLPFIMGLTLGGVIAFAALRK